MSVPSKSERAYYNDINPFCVSWLKNLIAAGIIPAGDVDNRSIRDVTFDDIQGYSHVHFFAGLGGWALAAKSAGWGLDRPLWTGSAPCQPFSLAGNLKGEDDERHLWPDFYRLIRACRPPTVVGEQVAKAPGLAWFDGVASDMETADYATRAVVIPACAVNAPIVRERIYWVACANDVVRGTDSASRHDNDGEDAGRSEGTGNAPDGREIGFWDGAEWFVGSDGLSRPVEPGIRFMVDGYPARSHQISAIGNAICVPLATEVLRALM